MKKFFRFYLFICLFPVWILSKNIPFLDKVYYLVPFLVIYIGFVFFFNKNNINKYKLILISLITTYGLDQNLSFNLSIIKPNKIFFGQYFSNIYYADLFLFFFIFLILYIFFLLVSKKEEASKIFFSFLLVIFVFKLGSVLFKPLKIINFNRSTDIELVKIDNKQTLFIILDEMSGINSSEKNFKYGSQFNKKILNFAKMNGLQVYTNTFSINENSATSIPFLLNFTDSKPTKKLRYQFISKSNEKYNEYDVIKNKFFEKYKNISVYQNIHLNFCNQKNVTKCVQFNPYLSHKKNLDGAKNNIFSKSITLWKIDGSSSGKIVWKLFQILGIIDNLSEPNAHKIFLPSILNQIEKDLAKNKFNLIFAHLLVPHRPYGFNKQCGYDGKLSSFNTLMKYEDMIIQHNLERICMIKILSVFFKKIKNLTDYENLNIIILSDHGSRISKKENYSSIFLSKFSDKNYKKIEKKISIQKLFKDIFEKDK